MTRTPEQVEADLLAAKKDHQAAVEAHGRAKQHASDLRARVIAGDPTVTAQYLAQAEDAAYHAELPIAAKFEAIKPLEAEHAAVKVERWADEFTAQREANRAELDQAWKDLEAAADRWVLMWRIDASHLEQGALAVGQTLRIDVSSRVRRTAPGALVDGVALRKADAIEPLERLARNTRGRLQNGQPKAFR